MLRKLGLKKEHREMETRQRLQKQLFGFKLCVEHGFPNKASAVAHDPELGLLCIGTKTGALKIFGAPGVQLSAQHEENFAVLNIFCFGQSHVVTLCTDNSLHLWEIATQDGLSVLQETQSLPFENRINNISASCSLVKTEELLLGTEHGHIYSVNLRSFKFLDQVIYQETVMQNAPETCRVNPGAVESVVLHPTQPEKILIGYNRGLIAFWNMRQNKTEQIYNISLQLECIAMHRNGKEFMTAHGNGSYAVWSMADIQKPKSAPTSPYGPFPCKAIHKLQWKTTKSGGHTLMVFSGGMPRASHGDHHTVTVMHGTKHVVYDFTSKVVDFFTICSAEELHAHSKSEYDDPHTLVVLVEEEIVFIDLHSENWPVFRAPYLATVHSSAITCSAHVANVQKTMWTKLFEAGNQQMGLTYSSEEWPIQGGVSLRPDVTIQDMLITGHEDGSVRFWDVSSTDISLIYKLVTVNIFNLSTANEEVDNNADMEDEWPPFRKVGTYDPFSDDPRLAIQKIIMCPLSEMLIIGGTAGQIIILQFEREGRELDLHRVDANLICDRDNFIWKGHDALPLKRETKFQPGFQPVCIVQLNPPATCTALALHSEWQLLSAGTAHGFTVIDYVKRYVVQTKCTLNINDVTGFGESTMSRRKSFKKSLRESFRRMQSGRSQRRRRLGSKSDDGKMRPVISQRKVVRELSTTSSQHRNMDSIDHEVSKPVERQVEARSSEDAAGSIVRSLYFADTFLTSAQTPSPTFWAGTNGGHIFIYQLSIPSTGRDITSVQCNIAKEIRLKHHAPVISICVIDRNAMPLPASFEVQHERAKSPDMSGNHSVIICSEEQLKVFSLPSLGAREKVKLTAVEGTKVRKVSYVNFRSRADESYMECDLVALTNQGEVHVYSVPSLRRQMKYECIKRDDGIGIGSCIFTQNGEAFYLSSSSEFSRFSISARNITTPMCLIQMSNEGIIANESVVSKRSPENSPNSSANRSPLERMAMTPVS